MKIKHFMLLAEKENEEKWTLIHWNVSHYICVYINSHGTFCLSACAIGVNEFIMLIDQFWLTYFDKECLRSYTNNPVCLHLYQKENIMLSIIFVLLSLNLRKKTQNILCKNKKSIIIPISFLLTPFKMFFFSKVNHLHASEEERW